MSDGAKAMVGPVAGAVTRIKKVLKPEQVVIVYYANTPSQRKNASLLKQMVKCKRKTSNAWTENDMQKAIKAFREGRSQRHAVELLGVPHSCLQRRLQSGQDNHLKSKGCQTTFTPEQENELVS
ncbi:hypothetical protein ANN_10791 [Periplaneta americana]|uniref:HTH psq-type domain-containing protein n=1 Tax=Periplaneta americana TaxID=6978 RepID=A0ABQ8T4W4_PERAM|nr:hypothetical protein ANN_10791 [Periplaneta americana]